MGKFDWSKSDGLFGKMVGCSDVKEWVKKCNEALQSLYPCSQIQSESQTSKESCLEEDISTSTENNTDTNKRKKNDIPAPAKKRSQGEQCKLDDKEAKFQSRVRECEVDGHFYVPVSKITLPPANRMIRKVDDVFLEKLKTNMEKHPNGSYEPLYLSVKGVKELDEFNKNGIENYSYEVLGGTHNVLATKQLAEKYPENTVFRGRYARLFVGLSDTDALSLASRHNSSGSFRHEMTFQDEVAVARHQLECIGETNQQWRDGCSHIMGKTKKHLSEVFLVAGLPEDGYKSFLDICKRYEKGELKEQRAMAKDLMGTPTFKPFYMKCLFGLDVQDRVALLSQVADNTISLNEFKTLCKEIKTVRPIQNIISSYLGQEWKILEEKLGEKVSAAQLTKYLGKDETNVFFRKYLEYLRKFLGRDEEVPETNIILSPNVIVTDDGTKGVIHMCSAPLALQQGSYGQDDGFTLAIYKLPTTVQDCDSVSSAADMLDLMDRLNFGVRQIFNVAILGNVENLVTLRHWITENRGICELGYICLEGVKTSGNHGMVKAVKGFLMYHAAIGQRILPDHFNFESGVSNFMVVDAEHQEEQTCQKLIELFSRPGDWILDVNIPEVAGVVAAVKGRRSGMCLVDTKEKEQSAQRVLRKVIN